MIASAKMGHETGALTMSLIDGARELAKRSGRGCTVEQVFLAALPPHAQDYLDRPTMAAMEDFTLKTLREWALQAQAILDNLKDPPPVDQDSRDLADVLKESRERAKERGRDQDDDRILLATLIMRVPRIQRIIESNYQDVNGLIRNLESKPGEDTTPHAAVSPEKSREEEEARRAREVLPDLLREYASTEDRRYIALSAVDVTTFLDFLADAAAQSQVVVAVGRDGTLIDELPKVVADRLAQKDTFRGQYPSLTTYTGKLYWLDLRSLLARAEQPSAPKPVSILRAAWAQLLALPEKAILLLDHFEAIKSDAKEQEIEDLRDFIANPGRLLVFGIYHAPNHGDHTVEANLGREAIVKTLPMTVYNADLTKALLRQFYLPIWRKDPPRGYEFTEDAFDSLIALEAGAWLHRRPAVLPCLVTDIVADAMKTAAQGDAQIEATTRGALQAFKELHAVEAKNHKDRAKFEPILNKAEKEVRGLLPGSSGGLFGGLFGGGKPKVVPGKPITITSANVMAEFICHNVSEFHYPGFFPKGITRED
jgi:hypothetical protein